MLDFVNILICYAIFKNVNSFYYYFCNIHNYSQFLHFFREVIIKEEKSESKYEFTCTSSRHAKWLRCVKKRFKISIASSKSKVQISK